MFASFAGSGAPNCAGERRQKHKKQKCCCRAAYFPALAGDATTTFYRQAKTSLYQCPASVAYSQCSGKANLVTKHNRLIPILQILGVSSSPASRSKSLINNKGATYALVQKLNMQRNIDFFIRENIPSHLLWKKANHLIFCLHRKLVP